MHYIWITIIIRPDLDGKKLRTEPEEFWKLPLIYAKIYVANKNRLSV